jgi:uncharacterized protein (DUF1501 family)
MPSHPIPRRNLLGMLLAGGAMAAGAGVSPRGFAQAAPLLDRGRLVVVFLRGAYDGLSALVPWSDPDYAKLRPNIAVAAPDGTASTSIELDGRFALHPALAPLLPMWRGGTLAVVPAAGSPNRSRSHFEAQHHWETGLPDQSTGAPGWLNRLAAMGDRRPGPVPLIGVGEANPHILSGPVRARLIPRGAAAGRAGVIGKDDTRDALLELYSGNDRLSRAFREGVENRLITSKELAAEMTAADNGAGNPAGLARDARQLAALMRADPALRIGFLSAGGWDTHVNQGAATGLLATRLADLARGLVQLHADFDRPGDVVLVLSEFGRTSAENGARGTDHGRGNALWLMGRQVAGGQVHGRWEGLARGNLNEGRDLPVLHDFRAVIAQPLVRIFGLPEVRIADLFPGSTWDRSLDGMVRRT